MNYWDDTQEPVLRAAPEKSIWRNVAETAGFPRTAAWMAGEYAGRPQSAPGPLYDILPEIGNYIEMIPGAAKSLANIPIQAARRSAIAKEIPQMAETFKQMGNPLTNVWKMVKGAMPEFQGGMQPAGEMALDQGAQVAASLPTRARELMGELKGSWGINIPYNPKGTAYPWAVVSDDANRSLLPQIAEGLGVSGRVNDKTRGFYLPVKKDNTFLGDVIAMRESAIPGGTPIHETGHLASKRVRGYGELENQPWDNITEARRAFSSEMAPQHLSDYLGAIPDNNPTMNNYLRHHGYGNLSNERMGEELWVRNNAGQTVKKAPAFEDPAPFMGERLSGLTEDLLHPYFKNYGNQPSATPAGMMNAFGSNLWDSAQWR